MLALDEFDYDLAPGSIAQTPVEPRDSARLLDAIGPALFHRQVRDLPELIRPGDVIVVNDTRVIPARLALSKSTGAAVEVMLLDEIAGTNGWRALVRPSRRVADGAVLVDGSGTEIVRVGEDFGDGIRAVRPLLHSTMIEIARERGSVPLPPYIEGGAADAERYQTVYARNERSVAAPTAGLHFTPELMERCRAAGGDIRTIELAVGLGTFRPIMVDNVHDHRMHHEAFVVAPDVLEACAAAERVIAIGTTSVRALESAATTGEHGGLTDLFISPGYEFKVVDVLLTNFHQPKSSLLVMLAAFAGPRWRSIYAQAQANAYRFLSFGDAMIVARGA